MTQTIQSDNNVALPAGMTESEQNLWLITMMARASCYITPEKWAELRRSAQEAVQERRARGVR